MPLKKRIAAGQHYLVREKSTGIGYVLEGPMEFVKYRKTYTLLQSFAASERQYIYVEQVDGVRKHIPGPSLLVFNRMLHVQVEVRNGIPLDASSAIVVYRTLENDAVDQRIVYGPTLFIPSEHEWLHHFSWHGPLGDNKTKYAPDQYKFEILKIIPSQMYFNVNDARTKDDAVMTIKLMIFYELQDVQTMLKQTADPIADIINAVSSDIINFVSQVKYEEFADSGNSLNNIDTYSNLMARAKRMGFNINKVVYRGFKAEDELQAIHNKASSKRNDLKLEMEKEVNNQTQKDILLDTEKNKVELERTIEVDQLKNRFEIEKKELILKLELNQKKVVEVLRQEKELHEAKMATTWAIHKQKIDHLKALKLLGVNLTDYLLNEDPYPQRVIQYVTPKASEVHIHHKDGLK